MRFPSRRLLAATAATLALAASQLLTAPMASADDDNDPLCYTTRSPGDPFYTGPSASRVYDGKFGLGVPIPKGLLDDRYVPQGISAWNNWDGKGEDIALISAYHDGNGDKVPDGPSAIFGVVVSGGSRHGTGLGRMLIENGHVGGIGVYKGWVYVGSEAAIRGYRASTVRSALAGANTSTVYDNPYNRPSSYTVGFMGTGDGHLWAGDFDENNATHLNGYVQTNASTGALAYQSSTQSYAPKKTQGVLVTPSYVIFSTSFGRGDRGNLWVMRRNQDSLTDANSYCFRAPSMNQGLTTANGRLYVGFESGAYTYNHTSDVPVNPVRWVHSADLASVTGLFSGGPAD